eukprot:jgi/Mesvir1/18037/Mv09357-RA.2
MGIDKYNEECRSIVMRYSKDWEVIVTRLGRWIDFEKDYKTLDLSFMESVWWVFKQLHEKGLVYSGFKVMPYSIGCSTPLSNFEAGLNYKDVSDPAVVVSFPLLDDPDNAHMIAWTTTPWTLPSNLGLCVNEGMTYLKVRNSVTGSVYILAQSRLAELPAAGKKGDKKAAGDDTAKEGPKLPAGYELIATMKGGELKGRRYTPLFDYFAALKGKAFIVMCDNYVTDDSGTGIVHIAPAFGEDDYRVSLANGIIEKGAGIPCPVDDSGRFTTEVPDFAGVSVKEADKAIIATIKEKGRLVSHGSLVHSYPFCWRSETPLIYKAVPCWFVGVEAIKEKLLANNKKTRWVPEYVQEKRFHNWLENARDWAVSRNRFWGTPLPIWRSDDGEEMVVIGSVEELEQLTGFKATDLHRHKIDHLTIPSKRGPQFGVLRRVEEVFDCWFESGSMPYAYLHYPFENKELFENNFPADFVAEGLDQTRGWFYTLMVLSTALFDKPAFRNLICNGLVLAADGKKMSKRLRNYPPPMELVDKYGADALRLYLINSPVVRAEPLRFKEEGVYAGVRDVFLPWYNAYRFLVQNAHRLEMEAGAAPFAPRPLEELQRSTNVLDRWILSSAQNLTLFVKQEMEAYRLYTVVPRLLQFIDALTNLYVRLNRSRLKGRSGEADCRTALATLYEVLLRLTKIMAPFTPFFTEHMYQNLRRVGQSLGLAAEESVHFCSFPDAGAPVSEEQMRMERSVARMQIVFDLARNLRERHSKPLKFPLKEMVIVHPDADFLNDITGTLREYVMEEVNVRSLVPCADESLYTSTRAEPEFSALGKRLGKSMGAVAKAIKELDGAAIKRLQAEGKVTLEGHELAASDIKVIRDFKPPEGVRKEDIDAHGDGDVLVVLDLRVDTELMDAGVARELVNRVQKLRKKTELQATDLVEIFYQVVEPEGEAGGALARVISSQESYIKTTLMVPFLPLARMPGHAVVLARETADGIAGASIKLWITKPSLVFVDAKLAAACNGDAARVEACKALLLARDPAKLRTEVTANGGKATVTDEGHPPVTLTLREHFFLTAGDSMQ